MSKAKELGFPQFSNWHVQRIGKGKYLCGVVLFASEKGLEFAFSLEDPRLTNGERIGWIVGAAEEIAWRRNKSERIRLTDPKFDSKQEAVSALVQQQADDLRVIADLLTMIDQGLCEAGYVESSRRELRGDSS